MADKSAIEWTDATWNPTTGCSIVSPGCTNCYAMKVANGLERRFNSPKYRGLTKIVNGNAVWTGEVRLDEAALLQPLKWKRPRRIFVNSMSDLFHEALQDFEIAQVFGVMTCAVQHTYQVLTKRAERMRDLVSSAAFWDQVNAFSEDNAFEHSDSTARTTTDYRAISDDHDPENPPSNIWLGVSCERQQEFNERWPLLRDTPAAIRFISYEPALGRLDASEALGVWLRQHSDKSLTWERAQIVGPRPDWFICGGESGPNARPMHPEWARSLRDQCEAAGVSYFFKQWGEWGRIGDRQPPVHHLPLDADTTTRVGKKAAGRLLDGREHNEFPQAQS